MYNEATRGSGKALKRGSETDGTPQRLKPVAPAAYRPALRVLKGTRNRADNAAIATVGVDPKTRRIFLLDMWAKRAGVPALRDEIVKRALRTAGLRAIGIETAGFQLGLVQDLKRMYQLPIVEIPYRSRRNVMHRAIGIDRDKTSRVLYLNALMTSGRLFFPKYLPTVDGVSLETELIKFPNGKHDDRIDALAFACVLGEASRPRQSLVRVTGW